MSKQQYNYEYLQKFCKENEIILGKDYSEEKITRDTIIEGICLTDGCENHFCKDFRQIVISGGFCKECTELNRQKKVISTNLRNYGCMNVFQSEQVKDKITKTNINRYGDKCALRNPLIKEKQQNTNIERYGDTCALRNPLIKEKQQTTNIERYGGISPMCSNNVKNKCKQTSLVKYGYEYPMLNAEYAENIVKKSKKTKDYTFPSGRIEEIQGYEHYMLDELVKQEDIMEEDILVKISEVPTIWYKDSNGKQRRYFVDCFIKSQNKCIEAKSTWTAKKKEDCIFLKQQALKDAGYNCEIWVYNNKGEKVECYK
jgi:hypothetical protein